MDLIATKNIFLKGTKLQSLLYLCTIKTLWPYIRTFIIGRKKNGKVKYESLQTNQKDYMVIYVKFLY